MTSALIAKTMKKFDLYLMRDLTLACAFITLTLAAVVFLTQSLRFLELVINSGASSGSFWILTLLALPRFFEIILPLSIMASVIFVFHRMAIDSELVALKASGFSPFGIARSALLLGGILTVLLWVMTLWIAPLSLNKMQKMQEVIKAQISSYLFREGVFNSVGDGLTVYIRERSGDGILNGLLIHDRREKDAPPSTVMAKQGTIAIGPEGYEVVVYDGSRQVYDPEKRSLQRLNFERYTIKIPDSGPVRQRWREPDERTFLELLNPDPAIERDVESARDFTVEIHKRLTSPLLILTLSFVAAASLLLGPSSRYGHTKKIVFAIVVCVLVEGGYLAAFNLARQTNVGFVLMYALVFIPLLVSIAIMSPAGEKFRRTALYGTGRAP